jgi:polyisoprenoid-binding protein YceI
MFTLPRVLIGGVATILVVGVVAGAGWWFLIRDDAKLATSAPAIPTDLVKSPTAAPAAGTSPSAPGAAAQTAQAAGVPTIDAGAGATAGGQTFTILSDRSEAAYFADEKLASLPLPSTAKGTTTISGAFHLTADGAALDTSQPSTFSVDLAGLKSDKAMRDRRVQSTLETGTYATAMFTAESATGFDPSVAAGQEQTLVLRGTLDLHGVKKQITWDVKARKQGGVITALATVTFPFEDFNLSPPSIGGFVSVQDHITLQVQIVAQAQ